MPYQRKPGTKILYHRFMSPPNARGVKKRLYVQCPPQCNTTVMLKQLIENATKAWVSGNFTKGDTFGSYVTDKFIDEYAAARGLLDDSKSQLQYLLEKLAAPTLGPMPLVSIGQSEVAKMIGALRKAEKPDGRKRYSQRTIHLAVVAVVQLLKWACKVGDIGSRPEIDIPRVTEYLRPKPYNANEVKTAIGSAELANERAALKLLFETGMRESEVIGLQWSRVDWEQKVILVNQQLRPVKRVREPGDTTRKRREYALRPPKNKKERRIPMTPQLVRELRSIQHMRSDFVLCHDGSDPRFESGKPYSEAWIKAIIRRARAKTGLRHNRVHDARHQFATRCTSAGMNAFEIQALLGHSDIRTTMGYVHADPAAPPSVLTGVGER